MVIRYLSITMNLEPEDIKEALHYVTVAVCERETDIDRLMKFII